MINVKQADRLIKEQEVFFPAEEYPLGDSLNRVLRENVLADRDYPPADISSMDGYAINYAQWKAGIRSFSIMGVQPAGQPSLQRLSQAGCFEIMTGAVLPKGSDCVVPLEDVERKDEQIFFESNIKINSNQFVRSKAQYCRTGQVLLAAGRRLSARDLVVAAEVGKANLLVTKMPSVAVVSSGDELCLPNKPVAEYQTRLSNCYGIIAALSKLGFGIIDRFHINDNKEEIMKLFARIFSDYQVIISSGAVSKGQFDFIPQALSELKTKIIFHHVTQKPGKPLLFGKTPKGGFFFGLPGNPISTQICLYRYVLPFLDICSGLKMKKETWLPLAVATSNTEKRTCFLTVENLIDKKGRASVQPVPSLGSGDFTVLSRCSGFVELDPEHGVYEKGEPVRFFPFEPIL